LTRPSRARKDRDALFQHDHIKSSRRDFVTDDFVTRVVVSSIHVCGARLTLSLSIIARVSQSTREIPEVAIGKELVGNLRDGSQSAAARVHTRLRVTTELTSREVQEHKGRAHCVPTYIFGHDGELRGRPDLQALGRHYFKW
jgi:hypothetical protein